jgi:hypothetical protein
LLKSSQIKNPVNRKKGAKKMKVLQRTEKRSKKGELMWSVKLDDNRIYDAYKMADDYELRTKGAYSWAVPIEGSGGGTSGNREDAQKDRNTSIERQNACRHTATLVAAFIQARPTLTSKEVDALVSHYFSIWHGLIKDGQVGE